jgi:hypothetical protein
VRGRRCRLFVQQNTIIKTLSSVSFLIDGIAWVDTNKRKRQKEMRVRSCVIIGHALFQKLSAKIWHVPKIRHVPKIIFVGGDDSSTGKSEFQKGERFMMSHP